MAFPPFRTVFLRSSDADALYEAERFQFRRRPGAVVTAKSLRPGGGYRLTFHRAADLPWNARRKPLAGHPAAKRF